ncbi:HlyD family type I secretion periplasmic adaptor subunit [Chelatococcus composti]|jgi:type I secretion membrane fusion protein, HlyD family|uniref:Membrane fusion protein (MFP) family protein n=1 Tax=Chelatococcus composti TaxID=1743235 RepID=A0A841KHJ0_9HYPH|nr:HlyD family type I secretion periplasmic adaptor subunit [Chelatococcus composti]MBB6168863.1 HlyD family secretion protein [Chelatococcus composti]MBS7737468.1 HlyD family type I secretion periplasmic adaptor subunit [Chelatococcus composti]GGG43541.1 HlyD family type I secretion periplasmic adaptor subunit [Chelatococcus composti]
MTKDIEIVAPETRQAARRRASERRLEAVPTQNWAERFEAESPPAPTLRGPVTAGLIAIVLGLGGFVGWAFSAQLDSAAVASATVIVDSKRKTVSHLEGGILKQLLVHEGETVKAGQPLVLLDDTRARAEYAALDAKRIGLEARLVRLRAEQARAQELVFPEAFEASPNPIAQEVMRAERNLFRARREMFDRKVDIQRKTIEQQEAELAAIRAQTEANARQRELLDKELKAISTLVEKGYAPRPRLTELQTRESELAGRAGELVARKAKAEQAKASAELEILSLETDFQQQVAADLQQAQLELADTTERMHSARDVLERVAVLAPEDGIVTDIRMRTPGGVIGAGQPILDLVPVRERLVVEAKVSLRDIDSVHEGAPVRVRLLAYNNRSQPPLDGRLIYLSADQQIDERNQAAFYVARAEILPESLAANPSVRLYPGMPAEVLIINKPRLAVDYLLSPITESFNRAFREE